MGFRNKLSLRCGPGQDCRKAYEEYEEYVMVSEGEALAVMAQ